MKYSSEFGLLHGEKHVGKRREPSPESDSGGFFEKPKDWAHYKHTILGRYFRIWVYHLQKRSNDLAYIDTCAGAGRYGDGQPGSPLIAAGWNSWLSERGKKLLVFACEHHPDNAAALADNLKPYIDDGLAVVIPEHFGEHLPSILERTRHTPTFIFIDPYGNRDVTAERLKPLLKDNRREPTEVLLRVDQVLLARFAGWLRANPDRSAGAQKAAEKFRGILEEMRIDPALLEQVEASDPGEAIDYLELLDSYMSVLKERFKYVQRVAVRASFHAAPKYYLIHGTDSEHGLVKMNDTISKVEDELYDKTHAPPDTDQVSLFDALDLPAPSTYRPRATVADAKPVIIETILKFKRVKFLDVQVELVKRFGPDLRERDHNRAVRELEKSGMVVREKKGSNQAFDILRLSGSS